MMEVKPWGDIRSAKIMIIGHDARLQTSDTLAEYAFFLNYFFNPLPSTPQERAKYNLAKSVLSYISELVSYHYKADEFFITNLCNAELPHAPQNKTVLIPEKKALKGYNDILDIMKRTRIEIIFAMSLQVNYWLQKFGLYTTDRKFLKYAEPKSIGLISDTPYYSPPKSSVFKDICGNIYDTKHGSKIIPILHVKNWPLKGKFKTNYENNYIQCIYSLKNMS
jgi:hypothetical protein